MPAGKQDSAHTTFELSQPKYPRAMLEGPIGPSDKGRQVWVLPSLTFVAGRSTTAAEETPASVQVDAKQHSSGIWVYNCDDLEPV